jgi:hypothetical protein
MRSVIDPANKTIELIFYLVNTSKYKYEPLCVKGEESGINQSLIIQRKHFSGGI